MKKAFFIIFIFYCANVLAQDTPTPTGFEILAEKVGNLDKDEAEEKVIVYNTTDTTEDGIVRELRIFKLSNNEWGLWSKSRNAIKKSKEGGMMGDPFEGIEIDNGVLKINSAGGSSWKWNYTDKYRFQNNEFELIGYSTSYGKLCEYWEEIDFNLSTGKIIYKKEFEDCKKGQQIYKRESETFFKKGVSINIKNRNLKDHKIISPKYKHELYL